MDNNERRREEPIAGRESGRGREEAGDEKETEVHEMNGNWAGGACRAEAGERSEKETERIKKERKKRKRKKKRKKRERDTRGRGRW